MILDCVRISSMLNMNVVDLVVSILSNTSSRDPASVASTFVHRKRDFVLEHIYQVLKRHNA